MSIDDATDAVAAGVTGEELGVSVGGSIRRLNPQDGLFLKAEHLDGMQDYARVLSQALGTAYGTGVVNGFGLSLQRDALVAGGGLAVTRSGEPLLCSGALRLPLDGAHVPPLDDDGYWLVVLGAGSQLAGSESAYGTVCADPCDGGGTIHPWLASTVVLRLRARTMPGLDSVADSRHRRNFLASGYFEQERRESGPWTMPRQAGTSVPPLLNNPWDQPGITQEPGEVPIGVLLKVDGEYIVDLWSARREVGGPPAAVRWAGHVGMRPWSGYWAQVLQFMDQFKLENQTSGNPLKRHEVDRHVVVDLREQIVNEWVEELPPSLLTRGKTKEFVEEWKAALPSYSREVKTVSLLDLGFDELPPAGFLAPVQSNEEGLAKVERLFAGTAMLRYCHVRADTVAGAMQAAQHLDRIPLRGDLAHPPEVDILVPTVPADLEALRTDRYDWVAFVRRTTSSCEPSAPPRKDEVDVVEVELAPAEVLKMLESGHSPASHHLTTIVYVAGSADLPPDQPSPPGGDLSWDAAIGAAPTDADLDLAKKRLDVVARTWGLTVDQQVVVAPGLPASVVLVGHREA